MAVCSVTRVAGRARSSVTVPSSDIQIDMFDVGLGASILLQFRDRDLQPVRVLADGGAGPGCRSNRVCHALPSALKDFADGVDRIDLLVGTHYDKDHLSGLVPVVESGLFELVEAWLPPVVNDMERLDSTSDPVDTDFLARQFWDDPSGRRLLSYLEAKWVEYREAWRLPETFGRIWDEDADRPAEPAPQQRGDDRREEGSARPDFGFVEDASNRARIEELYGFFRKILSETSEALCIEDDAHADAAYVVDRHGGTPAEIVSQMPDSTELLKYRAERWWYYQQRPSRYRRLIGALMDGSALQKVSDAIQRGSAKDAVNAVHLAELVTALRRRQVPMRCLPIPPGEPLKFVWDGACGRFVPGPGARPGDICLAILGPSLELVKKHADRLPVGSYALMGLASAQWSGRVVGVTPSNQLSYVMTLGASGQKILISGDAGFSDFQTRPKSKQYYPDLLAEMSHLDVVQVAHHGGASGHFYNVLWQASSIATPDRYLLLSHAVADKHRPSREFHDFVELLASSGVAPRILFTSEPQHELIQRSRRFANPPVRGHRTPDASGVVRLAWSAGCWTVQEHAVHV